MFSRSRKSIADIPTRLPCLGDLENLGQLPVQRVLMIVSYEFLKFLHYLCFRGWGIHFWYSYWATMFRWPRKSRSTSGTGGTRRHWWILSYNFWNFFSIHVREVKKSIADIQATEFWHFYRATMSGWPQKFRSTSGSGGTDDSVLWIFEISLLFRFPRSRNPLLIFLLSYLVRVTSKIWVNFRF